jgi:hypothetical protein
MHGGLDAAIGKAIAWLKTLFAIKNPVFAMPLKN